MELTIQQKIAIIHTLPNYVVKSVRGNLYYIRPKHVYKKGEKQGQNAYNGSIENQIDGLKGDIKKKSAKIKYMKKVVERYKAATNKFKFHADRERKIHDYMREHYPVIYYECIQQAIPDAPNIPERYKIIIKGGALPENKR